MSQSIKSQSGITLVLALLTMAALTAVAVAVSVIILNEILSTRGINYSITSFYAAESGIEKSLWTLREQRRLGASIEDTATLLNGMTDTLTDSRIKWEIEAIGQSEAITVNLRQDESAFFDIYDPDHLVLPTEMELTFDECAAGPTEVEASWTGWAPTADFFLNYTTKVFPVDCSPFVFQLDPNNDDPEHIRLQLRAFNGAATNLTFTVYDEGGQPISLSSTVQLTAVGKYPEGSALSAVQAIQAEVPWVLPISGIYSYVVYSEETLSK